MSNSSRFLVGVLTGILIAIIFNSLTSFSSAAQRLFVIPPISGEESRLENLYNSLLSLGHGSEIDGVWGDWGLMWNRIRSAAEWVPSANAQPEDVISGATFFGDSRNELVGTLSLSGDAIESDVASGKTFYSDSFTLLTGTASLAMDYSLQQYPEYDDFEGPGTGNPEDYMGDEADWTNTSTNVWRDERTGLYWTASIGSYSNLFPDQDHSACDFFNEGVNPTRGDYETSDANTNCGNAINACADLALDANNDGIVETKWYLPSLNEIMQSALDGLYNQTTPSFAKSGIGQYWTSTEISASPSYAWAPEFWDGGYYPAAGKSNLREVKCVLR